MKKIVYILLLAWSSLHAQTISVISTQRMNLDGRFRSVKFDNSGEQILLTTSKNDLMLYNLSSKKMQEICAENADVSSAVFSDDNSVVYFTKSLRENNLLFKDLYAFNLNNKTAQILEHKSRTLTVPKLSNKNNLVYAGQNKMKRIQAPTLRELSKEKTKELYACIEEQHLVLYVDGVRQILDPCGEGSYIWPSISPDGTKILFTEVRAGTFVYNVKTKHNSYIGDIEAPTWIDNSWITGMETKDDGEQITQGRILIVDSQGKNKKYVSPMDEISMYPTVARDGKRIAFATNSGSVYIVNYEFK